MVRRLLRLGLASILIAAPLGGGYLFWAAKRAEPDYSGEVALSGLEAPVTVRFGPHAVPTIEAKGIRDLLFAQGYLVAAERMWQMDLMRRLASGRLAEVMGEKALSADVFFRTVGLAGAARESLDAMQPNYRALLESYAAGVNAYRERAAGRLPLEYLIAGFEPAPWTPADSLAIAEYMSWMLSFNGREELVFLRLAARLGNERALELFPTDEGLPAPEDARGLPAFTRTRIPDFGELLALPARFGLPVPGAASNAWAINGARTADGRALLANDPHLAPSLPGIWYELELIAPDYHVSGVSLPGVPLIIIGHNEHLAWGFTTVMADTQDIFVERLAPEGDRVLRPGGGSEPVASREEHIPVRGRDEPQRIGIRSTSLGVVINDVLGANTGTPMDLAPVETNQLLALRWNREIPDSAIAAFLRLNTARTLDEARTASLDLKHASQNLLAAHVDGGIAWQVTGLLPERGRGSGAFPAPGWEPGYGWDGYVPQSRNPGVTNPGGFALVTANNRTIPPDYPVVVGHSWMAPYRARRVEELLSEGIGLTPGDMADIQLDRVSLQARLFKQALERVAPEINTLDPQARRSAAESLATWRGDFAADSRPAALFVLVQQALFEGLFGDELGEDLPALLSIAILTYNPLDEALYSGKSSFWDDVRTPEREGPAHIWARALRAAKAELDRLQPELGEQRLERLRHLRFPHAFDRVPLLGGFFGVGPIPVGGDTHSVNTMKASPARPEEALFIPSLRVVYTPEDWSQTRGTLCLGQSGHRFSPFRDDQLEDWLAGRYHPWPWNGPPSAEESTRLVLTPASMP